MVHYCVANMPGAVARTSTFGLTNATFPYVEMLAKQGFSKAIKNNAALKRGVNTYAGKLTNAEAAKSLKLKYTSIDELIK